MGEVSAEEITEEVMAAEAVHLAREAGHLEEEEVLLDKEITEEALAVTVIPDLEGLSEEDIDFYLFLIKS